MALYCCCTAVALALFATPLRADDDPFFRTVPLPTTAGYELGRGYDILTGKPRADCIDRATIETHSDVGPNSVSFHSTRIENSRDLDRALGFSASASLSFGSLGGSASATSSNNLSINSYSLYYLVDAKVSAKGDSLRDAKIKTQYIELLENGGLDGIERFRNICGDGYITEFVIGGGFQSLITIHTKSESEKQALASSLGASFSFASGSASYAKALTEVSTTNEITIQSMQRGGDGNIAITPEQIESKIEDLPTSIKISPSLIEAAVFSYILLLDKPNLPMTDFTNREIALSYLSQLASQARDQEADAAYILDHPSEFHSLSSDIPLLAQEIGQLVEFQNYVKELAGTCIKSGGYCEYSGRQIPVPLVRPARR